MSLDQKMQFLQDVFQMTAIALVSVKFIIILIGCIYFETLCIYIRCFPVFFLFFYLFAFYTEIWNLGFSLAEVNSKS